MTPATEKPRSLLSMGSAEKRAPARPSAPAPAAAAAPGADDKPDPSALHRLARSRREATPNRLLAALAMQDAPPPQTQTGQTQTGPQTGPDQAAVNVEPVASAVPETPARPGFVGGLKGTISGLFSRSPQAASAAEPAKTPAAPPAVAAQAQAPKAAPAPVDRIFPNDPVLSYRAEAAPAPAMPTAYYAADPTWRPLIDPARVIGGVGSSKMLIVTTTVLGALIGVAIALATPKKYESASELLVDPRDLQLTDRTLTETGLPSDATLAIVENQVRVITSGTVLNKVVDRLDLASDPEFNGERKSYGIRSVIKALRTFFSSSGSAVVDHRRTLAVGNLADSLTVARGGKTFVVVIAARTESPEKSALVANTVTEVFLETYSKLQSDTAGRAAGELTARLDELRAGLEEAERKVELFKAENDLIDANGRLITDDEIGKLNEQLTIARARTIELNAKAASTRAAGVDSAVGGTLPEEISSNTMVELRTQYASLKRTSDRMTTRLGPRHPERIAVETELDGLRGEIAAELSRIVAAAQVELKRAVQLEQDLAARLAQLKVRQGGVSDDLVTLRELEREATAKRAVYEAFLLRAREAGEQKDINTANISVISEAFPPLDPTGPSRALISAAGMMLGFMAGVGLGGARGAMASLSDSLATRRGRRRGEPALPQPAMETPPEPDPKPDPKPDTVTDDIQTASSAAEPKPTEARSMFSFLKKRSEPMPAETAAEPKSAPETRAEPPMNPAYPYAQHPMMQPAYPQQQAYAPQAYQPMPPAAPAQPIWQHPAYANSHPQAPYLAQPGYPQQQPSPYPQAPQPGYAQPVAYPPAYAAQPAYPYPQPMPQPPVMWAQPAPQPAPYPAHMQAHMQPQAPYYADPNHAAQRRAYVPEVPRSELDEVRDSLREFRDAVREVTETRLRRRA